MNEIKTKLRQLSYKIRHGFLSVENVVLVVAIVLCLVWTYQSILSMSRNWELVERLNSERKALELAKVEVETAQLENEYYASYEYQELMARKLANKQLNGEKMVYLPENTEVAKNKHNVEEVKTQEKEYSNFEKWVMYLFPIR